MIENMTLTQSYIGLGLFAQMQLIDNLNSKLGENLGGSLLTFVQALLILIIGLIFANWFKGFIKKQLHKTDIDNKIADWVTGDSQSQDLPIEEWISEAVGWLITLFVAVAFLNALKLEAVSQPLNTLLQEVTKFLPRIGGAALLLGLAWLVATVVKLLVKSTFTRLKIDEKLNQQVGDDSQESTISLGETLGNTLYWFIFLLFLPSLLDVLQLGGTLRPLEELVNNILSIIPNILAAVIIGAVGWVVAQIVKKVITNLLTVSGVNKIGEKFGLKTVNNKQSLAQIIGAIAYVLVLIPIAITALDALKIQAISAPATAMLNQVLDILPKLFAASVILTVAYVAGQYISELVTNLLNSIGFDNIFQWLGFNSSSSTKTSSPAENTVINEDFGDEEINRILEIPVQPSVTKNTINRTPSELVGLVVVIGIMLVASLTAVDILQIEALKNVVSVILLIAGQILIGVIIFAIGLYFANLAFNLISSNGSSQSKILAQSARISIIVLVSAMALERIGIAPNIVNLAFGLLTGGIAVAIALAFGLGGRETAGKVLQKWFDTFDKN